MWIRACVVPIWRQLNKTVKIELDVVQNTGQKAVILVQTIASQKIPAARLPEERLISTVHMKKLEYVENVQRIYIPK